MSEQVIPHSKQMRWIQPKQATGRWTNKERERGKGREAMFLPFTFPSTTRHLMRISGPDALPFLQGVLSCGVAATQTQRRGPQRPSVPAANTTAAVVHPMGVFTPRGRLLCEGFLVQGGTEGLLLDVHQQVAPLLHTYLCRMRLRKQVRLEDVSQQVGRRLHVVVPSVSAWVLLVFLWRLVLSKELFVVCVCC